MTESVFITIGGKERRLKYDINAAAEMEELMGGRSLMFVMGNPASAGIAAIRIMLWGGLKHAEKGLTLQRVGVMMQEFMENGGQLATLTESIGLAIRRSKIFGESESTESADGDDEKNG